MFISVEGKRRRLSMLAFEGGRYGQTSVLLAGRWFSGFGITALASLFLDPKELPSMLIDKPMPQFQLRTVDGESVTNANLPEQIFLLNVWGSLLSAMPCGASYYASF